jgi:hypothetical protein
MYLGNILGKVQVLGSAFISVTARRRELWSLYVSNFDMVGQMQDVRQALETI